MADTMISAGGGLSKSKLALANAALSDVLSGKTFYAGDKTLHTGTMHNNGRWPDAEKLTLEGSKIWMYQKQNGYLEGGLGVAASNLGNASPGHVLSGVSASSSNGLKFNGTMANRGAASATIAPGGSYTIAEGYHNGGGRVTARSLKTVTVSITKNLWNYTVNGTLVGFSNLSGGAAVVDRIYISGNTVYYENKTGGTINRNITLVYY